MAVLKLSKVSKNYGKATAVKNFDLEVEKGHICGLIGPNGAGKTTIMKMIAGLAKLDEGEMWFFGDNKNLDSNRHKMSIMLEAPIIDPALTAKENMQYVRLVKGVADEKKIDEILKFVGLWETDKKQARNFSLGMKQRLGIGMALLTDPEIMILDEPVNGLDPEGIVEIRLMLKKLAQERNITIIISSHLLSEMSELCTDFAIINHGELVEKLSYDELLAKCRSYIAIQTDDINKTVNLFEEKLGITQYKLVHGEEIHLYEQLDNIKTVSKAITDNGLIITKFVSQGESLEQYYLSKVGDLNA